MDKTVFNLTVQNQDLPSKIVAGLERISEAYRVLLWEHAKKIGLSPIQIQLLIFVKYHKDNLCNVSTLANEFNMTKATISDAVKALSRKELIDKIKSTIDKRAYSIVLTAKGEQLVASVECFANPIKDIVNQFSPKEQASCFEVLNKLIHQLNSSNILTIQRNCFSCKFYKKIEEEHFCKLLNKQLKSNQVRLDCPEHEDR
ncbi:MarR family winged helix-turn-helix transcriptional regulator [Aureispira anguillae]|uniref:MarR family winged helix-turn-helix transcriptional regulator n=1 Tax=Aureispira anguillae TaxID=2864201 RepID=A0A916DX35_9BACT|nr:MarR family winged helix-turn-helix transcriptional regulator [Aureispira anguillae]BDS15355.1 MarR family winged helix-turn-helix transcriptional regulator [Aureispira anguillae]